MLVHGARRVVCCRAIPLLLVCACTELQDGSIPYSGADDAAGLGDAGTLTSSLDDDAWACIGESSSDDPAELPERVTYSMVVVDTTTDLPPNDLELVACQLIDVDCRSPLTPEPVRPGPDGLVTVDLPVEFEGFFELRSADTVPSLFFMHEPLTRDTVGEPLPLISAEALGALASNNGVSLDTESSGLLLIRTYDCDGAPAAGIELSSDRGGDVFMFIGGLPLVGAEVTRADGIGGFINVPPGFVRVEGLHQASRQTTGAASLVVRSQWMTYGDLHPGGD